MNVYLIPYDQAIRIKDIPAPIQGDAYSTALSWDGDVEGEPAWATEETLEGLRALGIEPQIQDERPALPVFHSLGSYIDTQGYSDILSCIAYAKFDEEAKGICYIGHGCEREVWQIGMPGFGDYFFYYTQKESRNFIWFVVTELEDMEGPKFLHNLYHQDDNLLAWLRGMGLDPRTEEDEEE
jgi:hypothetical protein